MKQKENHRHREQTRGCQRVELRARWSGRLGLADVSVHIQDGQTRPTEEHRELYSISYDKP